MIYLLSFNPNGHHLCPFWGFMVPQLFWRVIMIRNLILAVFGYISVAILLLAGMLGKQICAELWNDMFRVLMQ